MDVCVVDDNNITTHLVVTGAEAEYKGHPGYPIDSLAIFVSYDTEGVQE